MRFKKQIIIVCLFTFLFVPLNSAKETKANPIALLPQVVVTIGELLVQSGIVISSSLMLNDLANVVEEKFQATVGKSLNTLVVDGVVNVTADVIRSIAISNIPTEPITRNVSLGSTMSVSFGYPYVNKNVYDESVEILNFNFSVPDSPQVYKYLNVDGYGSLKFTVTPEITKFKVEASYNSYWGKYVLTSFRYMPYGEWQVDDSKSLSDSIDKLMANKLNGTFTEFVDSSIIHTIPYDSTTTEKYNPQYLPNTYPGVLEGNPGISDIPFDSTDKDYGISFPWSDSLGGITDGVGDNVGEGDGTTDKPNTGDSVFDKFGEWLSTLLASLFKPLVDLLKGILDFLKNLFIPSELIDLDFTPLYFDLTKKFPFCLPFDFARFFTDFNNLKERPILHIQMPEKYFNSYTLDIDLAFYDDYFPFSSILRYFLLISFIYYLIKHSRNIIGG